MDGPQCHPVSPGASHNEPQGQGWCCTWDVNSQGTFLWKLGGAGRESVLNRHKAAWQPWGLFTVSSSDRSQHLPRPPRAKHAWCELPLLWEQKPTCVATVGASWAHSKCWIDWFVYWAFYLFCSEWWMNLVKEEGRERTIGFREWSVSCEVAEAASSY